MAGKEKDARLLLLDHAADARKAAGALSIDAFARDGYPDQFVLLEQWQSQKAWDDYAATSAAQQFRASLGKIESAGVDERIQEALFVDSVKPAAVPPLAVITHIDIIPTALERGRTMPSSNWSTAIAGRTAICASMSWSRPTGKTT